LDSEPVKPETDLERPSENYGLVGLAIAALIADSVQEELVNLAARKCMAYKGYHRYGITRAIYKQLDSGTDGEKLARKARIASGPAPQAEALGQ
jgi:hypothetical protein